ncbi:MAG: pyrimidine dimer DNA glycosylase/endonuclease V [Rikenellaceae bacterium]|nr:pyrimidine dimer DNA glycosylase/endonuclease V [Rikenellaceae bacterium]
MRLWSLHPQYLDRIGLTACWREGLLARKVLEGNTRGYVNHPQLIRFRDVTEPLAFIDCYLQEICNEAVRRGYNFAREKLGSAANVGLISVTSGQVEYEFRHLMSKLQIRDVARYENLKGLDCGSILAHPLFEITDGGIEKWEIIK